MTTTLYGIANCSTVMTARTWLAARDIAYVFHDYKSAGAAAAKLEQWCDEAGWETVLNRSGTTFRKLSDEDKSALDASKAITLMGRQPSMIKRPIVEHPGGLLIGFDAARWATAFRTKT